MKKLIVLIVIALGASTAYAGMTCRTDYFGNVTCTGTGTDSGWSTRGTQDYFGNETWNDNRGNTQRCSTDYFGNYTCN